MNFVKIIFLKAFNLARKIDCSLNQEKPKSKFSHGRTMTCDLTTSFPHFHVTFPCHISMSHFHVTLDTLYFKEQPISELSTGLPIQSPRLIVHPLHEDEEVVITG